MGPRRIGGNSARVCALGVALVVGMAQAADLPGSKDPAFLERFEGSEIVGYLTRSYDEYVLLRDRQPAWGGEFVAKKIERTEGAVTRIIYRVPSGHTSFEVMRNYQNALKSAGFTQTYELRTTDVDYGDLGFENAFYRQNGITQVNPFVGNASSTNPAPDGPLNYFTARATRDGQRVDVAVLAVERRNNSNSQVTLPGAKAPTTISVGQVIVGVDVIVGKAMENKMVVVKAEDMAKALKESGKVDVYGINFDTDKTAIKPESKPTLEEVARLLKSDPALKLEVAGHTDNVGKPDHNLKLSVGRANAVVEALTKRYGISRSRLKPKGYGDTRPVAPNDTEEGRAKNRRVELRKI